MAHKFYVVWAGRQTGVFTDWATTQRAVDKFAGARFRSFSTRAEAEEAFGRGGGTSNPSKTAGSTKSSTPDSARRAAHTAHQFDVSIYCDGACEPNPGHAGSGIVVYRAGELAQLWYGLYNPMGTNNTAELNALYHALRMAETEISAGNSVEICSDSVYSINCIRSWAPGWEKRGWKKPGGEIKNLEIIQDCYAIFLRIKKSSTSPTSPPMSAPKATNSPTAWPCSLRSAKKKNCACTRTKWISRRCSSCGRADRPTKQPRRYNI